MEQVAAAGLSAAVAAASMVLGEVIAVKVGEMMDDPFSFFEYDTVVSDD